MRNFNFILIMLVALLTACTPAGSKHVTTGQSDDGSTACSQDAMQCPDGAWVGRSGAKCEFICPGFQSK